MRFNRLTEGIIGILITNEGNQRGLGCSTPFISSDEANS